MKKIILSVLMLVVAFAEVRSQIEISATGTNSVTSLGTLGSSNTYVGTNINTASATSSNTLIGSGASGGTAVTISDGAFLGYRSGYYNGTAAAPSSQDNTFIGYEAGAINSATIATSFGSNNCFIGSASALNYAGGTDNTVIGYQSAQNLSGNFNTFIGDGITLSAPYSSGDGAYIGQGISIGSGASDDLVMGYDASIGTSVTNGAAIGVQSSIGNSTLHASAVGYSASIGSGANYSQALGPDASVGAGSTYCTAIGEGASVPATPLTYANAIGAGATVASSYATVIGRAGDIDNVGVGLTNPVAKVDIYRPALTTLVNPIGLQVINNDLSTNSTTGEIIGVNSSVTSTSGPISIGGQFNASDATKYTVGVYSTANCSASVGEAYGGFFSATSANVNTVTYGVWCQASGSGTNYAGYFDGEVDVNGYLTATSSPWVVSDRKFKTNISDLSGALNKIRQLKPKEYIFDKESYKSINFPSEKQQGFIAQDLEQILPDLVRDTKFSVFDKDRKPTLISYKAVNYTAIIPYLVEALQEMDSTIAQNQVTAQQQLDAKTAENQVLAQQVASLQSQLNDICNSGCAALKGNNTNTDGGSPADNKLLQNVPNPFSQQTTIGYVLNSGTTAYININALDGKLIKQVSLAINGAGSITVHSNEMAPGTYTYTLNVDGKVIDTKLMVITAQD